MQYTKGNNSKTLKIVAATSIATEAKIIQIYNIAKYYILYSVYLHTISLYFLRSV